MTAFIASYHSATQHSALYCIALLYCIIILLDEQQVSQCLYPNTPPPRPATHPPTQPSHPKPGLRPRPNQDQTKTKKKQYNAQCHACIQRKSERVSEWVLVKESGEVKNNSNKKMWYHHPSHPSIYPSIRACVRPSIYPSIHRIHPSTHPSTPPVSSCRPTQYSSQQASIA
jgi:hypothetical protein